MLDPSVRLHPQSYYHESGPVGDVFKMRRSIPIPLKVGIIGLGLGSLQCYAGTDETFDYFELDPLVLQIATDKNYFTYLSDCPGHFKVTIGDGRIGIGRTPDSEYDLLVLDAFSSDSIPVHLITREAVSLYLKKIKNDGILLFHISNRYLRLEPLLARLASEFGLHAIAKFDNAPAPEALNAKCPSSYFVMSRSRAWIEVLSHNPGWHEPVLDPAVLSWTDDYSNLLAILEK
jgi:spermidine synthase